MKTKIQQRANDSAIDELENIISHIRSGRVDVVRSKLIALSTITHAPDVGEIIPEQQYTITVREVR